MNALADRRFQPVVLGAAGPEPHPALTSTVQAIRRNKHLRSLAKRAAHQLRHLTDIAAFESYLARAALADIEQSINPVEWLQAEVDALIMEQSMTRAEHTRMVDRAERLRGGGA